MWDIQDRAGNTPLHLAVESGHAECAVALIEGGADRERGDSEGYVFTLHYLLWGKRD